MLQSIDGLRVQIYKENASYFRFNQFFFRLGLQLELSDRHRRRSHPGRYRPACRLPRWCTRGDGTHLYRQEHLRIYGCFSSIGLQTRAGYKDTADPQACRPFRRVAFLPQCKDLTATGSTRDVWMLPVFVPGGDCGRTKDSEPAAR